MTMKARSEIPTVKKSVSFRQNIKEYIQQEADKDYEGNFSAFVNMCVKKYKAETESDELIELLLSVE